MGFGAWRIPRGVQVGAVVLLFAAATATLWYTGVSVVGREERRVSTRRALDRSCEELAGRGAASLEGVRTWPYLEEPSEAESVGRRLGGDVSAVLAAYDGVDGGFFFRDEARFIPEFPARRGPGPQAARATPGGRRADLGPDEAEIYDMVETQLDAAIRKRRTLSVVEDIAPDLSVAVRAVPIKVGGRVVAAAWTMTRLVDPLFLDRSVRGYRTSAGLALGGIVLSLVLTAGLARTVRRQAAERARLQVELRRSERLAALGRLLAGVAHEVRNPLAGIRSTAQLWQRGLGIDGESVDGLVCEVDRLEGIVSRLLQFSRADAQDLAPGDLNAVLAEAARLARGPAEERGGRVDLDLEPDLPAVEIAEPALLQVFRNLTTNAAHAMPEGGTLRLSTRRHPSRQEVVAEVADTGPGLSPEALSHLFEPFFTTKAGGTGLGLAIAREIALAHRGDLSAANRADGPGALFTLTLPAASPDRRGGARP